MSAPAPRRLIVALAPLVVFTGLATLLFLRLGAGDASNLPSALIGRPAPPLPQATLDGASLDHALSGGKVTVVNVFGSWCEPCHLEHPTLLALAGSDEVKSGKVSLIGIAQKDSAENIRRFLGAEGDPYDKVALDTDGRSGIDWGVYGVPETFVIRGNGVVAYKFIGPLTAQTLASELLPQIRKAEN